MATKCENALGSEGCEARNAGGGDRVALGFELGVYQNPEWLGYPIIPEFLQSGRLTAARAPRARRPRHRTDYTRSGATADGDRCMPPGRRLGNYRQ